MSNWDDVENLIEKLKTISDIDLGGPASLETVLEVERKLEGKLPKEVVEFLCNYGSIFMNDESVSGIYDNDANEECNGTIVGDTEEARDDYGLPKDYAVIEYHSGDYCLCVALTKSTQKSSPVYEYNVFKRRIEEEATHDSFLYYLTNYLNEAVKFNTN